MMDKKYGHAMSPQENVMGRLMSYLTRVDVLIEGYQHGFRLFAASRAESREVNHQFAAKLLDALRRGQAVDIEKLRADCVAAYKINHPGFTDRGNNSSELSAIVKLYKTLKPAAAIPPQPETKPATLRLR